MESSLRASPLALTVLAILSNEPSHPYGIQRLIKHWGKDLVVNVGQRANVYRTIDRLAQAGLVAIRETERDQAYPERTVYEITDTGREVVRAWLVEMLAVPKQEYPQFPAALSHLMLLTSQDAPDVLEQRLGEVERSVDELTKRLETYSDVPRVGLLELEYLRAVTSAEAQWLRDVIKDRRAERLTWSREELKASAT
jgi:DNA-binding PadR family transcriptional regulator